MHDVIIGVKCDTIPLQILEVNILSDNRTHNSRASFIRCKLCVDSNLKGLLRKNERPIGVLSDVPVSRN